MFTLTASIKDRPQLQAGNSPGRCRCRERQSRESRFPLTHSHPPSSYACCHLAINPINTYSVITDRSLSHYPHHHIHSTCLLPPGYYPHHHLSCDHLTKSYYPHHHMPEYHQVAVAGGGDGFRVCKLPKSKVNVHSYVNHKVTNP